MKKILIIIVTLILMSLASGYYFYVLPRMKQLSNIDTSVAGQPYPQVFKDTFMLSCSIGKENCQCVLNYLEKNYSYDEFEKDEYEDDWRLTEAANYCKQFAQ